jgi:Protein of unknown function (DUF3105)
MTPERTDAERAESDRRRIFQLAAFALAAVAVTVVWIVALTAGGGGGPHPTGGSPDVYPAVTIPLPGERSLARAAARAGCTVRSFPNYGREHTTERVHYRTNPPTSGPHNPVPADDGIYDDPPPTEKLVHSLEHGRVIFQFTPGAPPKVRGQLKALVKQDPRHVILTANQTGMPFEVAATAWRHYVGCRKVNDATFDALRDFKIEYRDQAPEHVP